MEGGVTGFTSTDFFFGLAEAAPALGGAGGLGTFLARDLPAARAGMVFFLEGTGACVLEVDLAALGADGLDDGAAVLVAGFFDEEVVFLVTLFFAAFFFEDFFRRGIFFAGAGVFFGADFFGAVFLAVGFLTGLPVFLAADFLAGVFLAAAFAAVGGFLAVVFFGGFLPAGFFFPADFLLVFFLVEAGFFSDLAMFLEGYVLGGPASASAQRGQTSP
jgi:hypothetical protein